LGSSQARVSEFFCICTSATAGGVDYVKFALEEPRKGEITLQLLFTIILKILVFFFQVRAFELLFFV
jgi:hypothetical protein